LLEEGFTGPRSWFIGLTDFGHEGRWIWRHSIADADYTSWAPGYPTSSDPGDDCAVLNSRQGYSWTDVSCEAVSGSPVCMRDLEDDLTTTTTISSTTDYDYHVELQGGDGVSTGNVFAVNSLGYFGPVCDDHWTDTEADTVCRQLGFVSGIATTNSYFGNVPAEFAMDDVSCTPEDDIIQNCDHVEDENCAITEGAGVICRTETFVELRGGDGSSTGNVFVINNSGFYGPVCDDGWTDIEADTVCRSGYTNSI